MKKEKTNKKSYGVIVFLFLLVVVVVFTTSTRKNQVDSLSPIPKPVPASLPKYSDEQIHQFWDLHMNTLIMDEIVGGKYPISAINERYQTLFQKIVAKYGNAFRLDASTVYGGYAPLAIASNDGEVNPPVLRIFVPGVMNVYTMLRVSQRPTWEKEFEVSMVTAILHEMEHIIADSHSGPQTKKGLVDDEARSWDATCLYTLSAFVGMGYPLGPSEASYYKEWLTCGKGNNDCFKLAISPAYADILKHYR